MAVVARAVPYARAEGGAASAFVPSHSDAFSGGGIASWLPLATYGIAVAVILVVVSVGSRGLAVVAGELIAMAAVTWLAIRRIGGFTGDVLGAGGVIAETVGLLVLVAK
jgi:cobalamin synthase